MQEFSLEKLSEETYYGKSKQYFQEYYERTLYFLILALLALLVTIVGCTTFSDIEAGLGKYAGSHINSLVGVIGYPNGQSTIGGDVLYIWDSSRTVSYTMPTTSYNSGTVNTYGTYGTQYGAYSGTSTTYVTQTANYQCRIMVRVNSSDIIVGSQYEGNIGGCERYASAFRSN